MPKVFANKRFARIAPWIIFLMLPFGLYSNCGVIQQPAAEKTFSSITSFNHTGISNNCASCHATNSSFAATLPSAHPDIGGKDCSTCHVVTSWKTANPHSTQAEIPTSCSSCHASDNTYTTMQNIVTHQMLHSAVSAPPDCALCHLPQAQVSNFVDWVITDSIASETTLLRSSLGAFHANAGSRTPPSTCQACHAAQRPTGLKGSVALLSNITPVGGFFDHALSGNGGDGDCVSCHMAVPEQLGLMWSGAVYPHSPTPTTCLGCHTADQRPTGPVGASNFDHNATAAGQADCVSCHASVVGNIGKVWATQNFSHSPTPTSCASCHSSSIHYTGIQSTVHNQMLHSYVGLPDCATCHSAVASASGFSSWQVETVSNGNSVDRAALGIFHSNIAAKNINTCSVCHSGERPIGSVGTPAFDHAAQGGQGDCINCHAAVASRIGLSWKGGSYGHTPVPVSCTSCHLAQMPVGRTVPNTRDGFTHQASYGNECATCHLQVLSNIGVTWNKGYFNHNNNNPSSFTNCSPCHDTKEHHSGSNCLSSGCHYVPGSGSTGSKRIIWPKPSSSGNFGGSWSG